MKKTTLLAAIITTKQLWPRFASTGRHNSNQRTSESPKALTEQSPTENISSPKMGNSPRVMPSDHLFIREMLKK